MKKLTTLLIICCMALMLTFGLTACGDKACDHIYDSACDAICNECEETREVTTPHVYDDCADTECNECGNKRDSMHTWVDADCDTPKTCSICGATEGEALGHDWTTPDVDLCEVQSTCSRCGATDGQNKEHSPETDDGDCTTEVKCSVCGDVTTPAGQHTPNSDDGDCTTPITCSVCGTTTTPANDNHTGGTATCTAKAECTACGTAYGTVDANNHIDDNTDHICDRECGKTDIGTHADSNTDHACDYGCPATIGTHADTNNDHNCEYGCSTTIGVHSDSENDDDHTCDYGCGVTLEDCKGGTATCTAKAECAICGTAYGAVDANNHIDDNTDHICDRECGKTDVGTHEDKNNDHTCDYGCTTSIGTHSDSENDDDHTCDYGCGATLNDHTGGEATCVSGKLCEICGVEYDTAKNPDNHASDNYTYADNGDGTHSFTCSGCNETVPENHDFGSGITCTCGAKIEFTGFTFIDGPYAGIHTYDESTNTYTVIIPPDRYGVYTMFQITGKNLEYLEKDNTLLKVKENHSATGEFDFQLEDFLSYGFEIGWTGMRDGSWVEYQYSNDGGITWSKAVRAEVKQSYYVTVNASENGSVTAKEYAIAGETVTLNVSPAENYALESITVTDASGTPVTVENNAFTMPASAVTVTATFAVCDHKDSQHGTAVDSDDGTHSFTCTVCSGTGTEKHTAAPDSYDCICGATVIAVIDGT